LSITHYFYYDYREATLAIDFYRTDFEQVNIVDLDSNPQSIKFYSIQGGAYSNSLQIELNIKPFERFDARLAYRYLDVKQKIGGKMTDRALSSKNRALINFAYSTERESIEDAQMIYDLTLQWFDKKRIPSTSSNPAGLRARDFSPAFAVVNAQITRTFYSGFDLYLGAENLFDFRQKDLIIDPFNPHSEYFDASLIWGPVNGRMVYAGLRYKI
jgi:outer membrane receptor protein involved in Fe transport